MSVTDFRLLSSPATHPGCDALRCTVQLALLGDVEPTYLSLVALRHVVNIHKSGALVLFLLWRGRGRDFLALGRLENKRRLVEGIVSGVAHEGLIVHRRHGLVHWLGFVQRELKLAVQLLVVAYRHFTDHLDIVYTLFLLANFYRNFLFFPCHFVQVLLYLEKSGL